MLTRALHAYRILCLCGLFGLAQLALAQPRPGTGFPPFTPAQSGGFDAVNLQSLNVGFMVPVVSHPGRGLGFSYSLAYNSLAWRPVSNGTTKTWGFTDGWTTVGPIGTVTNQRQTIPFGSCQQTWFTNYVYTDPSGTPHLFPVARYTGCSPPANTLTGHALDASGYYMDISGTIAGAAPIVRAPDGTMVNFKTTFTINANGDLITQNPTITDPNGNQLTSVSCAPGNGSNPCISETDWTDTLGQTALKITNQYNGPNGVMSETDYSRLAVDGSYQAVALKYEFVTVQTNFGCSGVGEYTASNVRLVSEIDLPNGQKYAFTYEPTPGSTGPVTGRIKQVTLPTGGTITYQYPGPNGGLDCFDGASLQLTRTISDGSTSATWNYLRARNNKGGTTTITAPQLSYDSAANQTVITFDPTLGVETQRKIYQGAANGSPMRTINTAWSSSTSTFNITPTSQTVILEDGSTQSEVEIAYDTNGLLQSQKEHDWGSGAPGAVLRTTNFYYSTAYSNLNIIDRVVRQTVTDAGGTIKSRTDITYDDPGFINIPCITLAAQHDDADYGCSYTTRGLPTSVTTYTNASTPAGGVTKNFSYDSVGNLVSAQLNCCQQKQWNFSATTQYAFPDSVVSGGTGTQLTTSATYYLTTGQVKTSTDENGQITTLSYGDAGHLDRLTDIQRPDNAHITRAYDDLDHIVTDTSPVQGTNVVQTVTALDGLGRPVTTTTEDASNTIYSISQRQYDPLGRAYMASNPYTTSPQFFTTTQFDAMGRPTVVTLPDGAQTTSSYSTNSVTLTDPAGKQRRSLSNSLGQMIEVDEPGGGSAATPSSGSLAINGTLHSWTGSAQSATSGRVELTFSGTLQSKASCSPSGQPCTDSGTISITVAGFTKSVGYSSSTGTNSGPAVQALASAFHLDTNSPVDAIYYGADESGNYVMDLIARATGAATNYPLSTSIVSNNPSNFPTPSFQVSAGSSLIGGQDSSSGGTQYDSGVVYVSVGMFTASAPYSHTGNNTAAMIASALVAAGPTSLNQSGSPVTATVSGSTIALTYKAAGAATNVFVAADSSTANPDNPSFSSPGVTLSGGADAAPATLSTPAVTTYAYSGAGNLLQVTEGVQSRTYGYDDMGRVTDATTPEAGHVGYQYNSFSLLTQKTDARGVITTYAYDTLNRLQTVSYNVGSTGVPATPTVTYQYGTNSAQNNNGRLIKTLDGLGSEAYSYDQFGRVTQVQKAISGTTYSISYAYNLASELTQITYPSGRVVQQSFDAIGRLCEIAPQTTGCATAASPYATAYGYNSASQMTGFNYGNGVNAVFGYSTDRMQLTSLSYAKGTQALFGLNYFYQVDSTNCPTGSAGNNGQIQCITDTVDSGRNVAYTYDSLARLATAATKGSTNYPAWGLSFAYDRFGNRTAQTVTAGSGFPVSTPTDPATNRINVGSYTYDANGNMTNDGNNILVYDAANHTVSSTQSGVTSTYSYDCKSLRVVKSSGGTTTVYIFSGSKVIAEYQNGTAPNAPTREYIYSGSGLLAKIEGGTTNYYHADHLSTRATTDTNGSVVGQQGLYPFGDPWYDSGTTSRKKLADYERDPESGNDYALARSYVNRIGRFASPDPMGGGIGNPQGLNRYSYVANDPVNAADPSGMFVLGIDRFLSGWGGFGSNGSFGAGWDEFYFLENPTRVGTATLYHSLGDNFHFENYSSADLANFASEGELSVLGRWGIYNYALVDPTQGQTRRQLFRNAEDDALRRLTDPRCARAFQGGAARIRATSYRQVPRNAYPNYPDDWIATTLDATHVAINAQGAFYGNTGATIVDPTTNMRYDLTADSLRVLDILHELGHQLNITLNEWVNHHVDPIRELANDLYVLQNCF
jgi:RHS repeat-associated protein